MRVELPLTILILSFMFLLRNFSKTSYPVVKPSGFGFVKKNKSLPGLLLYHSLATVTARYLYAMADARADNGHRLSLANDS